MTHNFLRFVLIFCFCAATLGAERAKTAKLAELNIPGNEYFVGGAGLDNGAVILATNVAIYTYDGTVLSKLPFAFESSIRNVTWAGSYGFASTRYGVTRFDLNGIRSVYSVKKGNTPERFSGHVRQFKGHYFSIGKNNVLRLNAQDDRWEVYAPLPKPEGIASVKSWVINDARGVIGLLFSGFGVSYGDLAKVSTQDGEWSTIELPDANKLNVYDLSINDAQEIYVASLNGTFKLNGQKNVSLLTSTPSCTVHARDEYIYSIGDDVSHRINRENHALTPLVFAKGSCWGSFLDKSNTLWVTKGTDKVTSINLGLDSITSVQPSVVNINVRSVNNVLNLHDRQILGTDIGLVEFFNGSGHYEVHNTNNNVVSNLITTAGNRVWVSTRDSLYLSEDGGKYSSILTTENTLVAGSHLLVAHPIDALNVLLLADGVGVFSVNTKGQLTKLAITIDGFDGDASQEISMMVTPIRCEFCGSKMLFHDINGDVYSLDKSVWHFKKLSGGDSSLIGNGDVLSYGVSSDGVTILTRGGKGLYLSFDDMSTRMIHHYPLGTACIIQGKSSLARISVDGLVEYEKAGNISVKRSEVRPNLRHCAMSSEDVISFTAGSALIEVDGKKLAVNSELTSPAITSLHVNGVGVSGSGPFDLKNPDSILFNVSLMDFNLSNDSISKIETTAGSVSFVNGNYILVNPVAGAHDVYVRLASGTKRLLTRFTVEHDFRLSPISVAASIFIFTLITCLIGLYVFMRRRELANEVEAATLRERVSKEKSLNAEITIRAAAALVHDLKAPIAATRRRIKQVGGPDAELMESRFRHVRNLLDNLVDTLLPAEDTQTRGVAMIQVTALLKYCEPICADLFSERHLKLDMQIHPSIKPTQFVHHSASQRALDNLITNAGKYSELISAVTMKVESDEKFVNIVVSNKIRRLSHDEEGRLGTKLGIQTVRRLMDGIGGRFSSTVRDGVFYAELSIPYSAEYNSNSSLSTFEGKRFLVADDEHFIASAIAVALKDYGITCDIIDDISNVQDVLERTSYDALISDLSFFGALDAIPHLKEVHRKDLDVPIVAISDWSYAQISQLDPEFSSVVKGVIQKDFDLTETVRLIVDVLSEERLVQTQTS